MIFTKMESAGSDFIVLDNTELQLGSEQLSRVVYVEDLGVGDSFSYPKC